MPIIITITEQGNDVHINATCKVNLATLNYGTYNNSSFASTIKFDPKKSLISFSPLNQTFTGTQYTIPIDQDYRWGPTSGSTFPSDPISIVYSANWGYSYNSSNNINPLRLTLPTGYVSNTLLTGTMIFANATISSLGLQPGKFGATWGDSGIYEYISVLVGPQSTNPDVNITIQNSGSDVIVSAVGKIYQGFRNTSTTYLLAGPLINPAYGSITFSYPNALYRYFNGFNSIIFRSFIKNLFLLFFK